MVLFNFDVLYMFVLHEKLKCGNFIVLWDVYVRM